MGAARHMPNWSCGTGGVFSFSILRSSAVKLQKLRAPSTGKFSKANPIVDLPKTTEVILSVRASVFSASVASSVHFSSFLPPKCLYCSSPARRDGFCFQTFQPHMIPQPPLAWV